MKKKYFVSFAIVLSLISSFSICLANNDELESAVNDVRNFVGGAENAVEDAAKDISNTSKSATGTLENDMNHNTNEAISNHSISETLKTAIPNNYSATRTSTEDTTIMGMNSTAWTWLIIGIAAIAIIAIVWYYSMQFTNRNNHRDDN